MAIPQRRSSVAMLMSLAALGGAAALTSPKLVVAEPLPPAERFAFVLFSGGSKGADLSGSMDDVRRAMSLRVGVEGLLYARSGGAEYVIRDSATLRRVKSFFDPEEALGVQETQLGSRQTALGQQQSRLSAEQSELSHRQRITSPSEAKELGRQEEELSHRQEMLGRQQEALGRQQEALGREQEHVARVADGRAEAIIADAIRSGLAKRID